ncbi:MAG: class I SAM-dependent methyltransferase [Candidatus Zambryskibacteria bacterium]|nr:class I SAM-dependent methyltransferase [Candidatus Zambryskibacteria bacterium]
MKRINKKNINTPDYWNVHPTTEEFGLRHEKYFEIAGNGERIIDLGCGKAPFLDIVRRRFKESWGLDYSPETLKYNRQKFPAINYIEGDAQNTLFRDDCFDVVVAGEIIEHMENPIILLKEMLRICKPNGKLILSTAIMEYNDPEHIWEFNTKDFKEWGFTVEMIRSERFPGRSYIFAYGRKSDLSI